VHEAVALKVKISGRGNIKMLEEPHIVFPGDLESYDPKISQSIDRSRGIIKGEKVFEYVLIPRLGGDYRIPAFDFSYFDPEEGEYKRLTSPEMTLHVAPGGEDSSSAVLRSRGEVQVVGRDIRFIKDFSHGFHREGRVFYRSFWFFFLLVVPLMIFGGAAGVRWRRIKLEDDVAYARSRRARQVAKKRLSRAGKLMQSGNREEYLGEISRAMLGFIADKLNLQAAGLMEDDVADKLRGRRIEESVVQRIGDCIRRCDFLRFAPAESNKEDLQALYSLAEELIILLEKMRWA
jgi:hypothetical protein